ncbi:MAG TPA: DUF1223 domain-containing protein [Bryobacteraceae bacterium]|nr:DUF1223 domain-containing protein [Bryobacteraceae bacterium]
MRTRIQFAIALSVPALFCTGFAAAQARTPVIVELFTSEGCSSCPPADRLLARLETEQPVPQADILVMEEHVDYWDQQGWRDPFSAPFYTQRQQDYAFAFASEEVYTPEMVVDGRPGFVGSDGRSALQAIRDAAASPHALVTLQRKSGSEIAVSAGRFPPGTKTVDIVLAITEDSLASNVLRGENAGHRLSHAAVARSIASLARFDARKSPEYKADLPLRLAPDWNRSNLRIVVFVQDRNSRRILGGAGLHL